MSTRLDEVEDVDLLLKSAECFLVQGLLFHPSFVPFRLLEAAAEPPGPLGGKELEVREEAADTVEHSGLDLILVL